MKKLPMLKYLKNSYLIGTTCLYIQLGAVFIIRTEFMNSALGIPDTYTNTNLLCIHT